MIDLGTLGGAESSAAAVSADGRVIVGQAHSEIGEWRAVRWIDGTMQDLGTLGGTWAEAFGVSADGSVVVGWAEHPSGAMSDFRGKEGEGMEDLGTLGGAQSKALAVSADGSLVVGWSDTPYGTRRAFRWAESTGMEDLTEVYRRLLPDGSELREARAITPDGRFIVGWGYHAATGRLQAYLLDTQRTGSSVQDSPCSAAALSIEPQPVEENGVARYILPEAAVVRVELYDAFGRRKAVLFEGWKPAGEYTQPLPLLQAGLYLCRLQLGQRILTAPIIVLR
jgi:probable HAF family extracellular repeat protein